LKDSSDYQSLENVFFRECGLRETELVNFIKQFGQRLKVFKLWANKSNIDVNFENAIKECPRLETVGLCASYATLEVCRQPWACAETLKSLNLCYISRRGIQSNVNNNVYMEERRLASKKFVTQFRNL